MKKVRLLVILVFAAALLGVAGAATLRVRQTRAEAVVPVIKPAVVRAEPLQTQNYAVREAFYGLIEANARVEMAFQIAGRITQLGPTPTQKLVENDTVTTGQVLAMVEPERYDAAHKAALAKASEAKAAADMVRATVEQAQARLGDARLELERAVKLAAGGAAHKREVEKAELAVKLASAELDSATAQLAAAQATYDSAQASAQMALVNMQDATLKAPMESLVAAIPVELGQMVQPGQPVINLVDIRKVRLVVGVVERKLPLLKQGQRVRVEVEALSSQARVMQDAEKLAKPREGRVTIVPPAADPVTGLFRVEVELPNDDGLLRPGMVGKAMVTVMEKTAIAIPAEAVIKSGDRYWAYFVADGYQTGLDLGVIGKATLDVPSPVARRVEFTPTAIDRDHYLLADAPVGLDRLIVEGQTRLSDGQPVTVIDAMVSVPAPDGVN